MGKLIVVTSRSDASIRRANGSLTRLLALRAPAKQRYPLRVRSAKARFGNPRTYPAELPGMGELIVRTFDQAATFKATSGYFLGGAGSVVHWASLLLFNKLDVPQILIRRLVILLATRNPLFT